MSRAPFKLSEIERAALEEARRQFVAFHEGLPLLQPKAFAALRAAARSTLQALEPFSGPGLSANRQRLLVRMQDLELRQKLQAQYSDLITNSAHCLRLIELACAAEVKPGQKGDERAHTWIRTAAASWRRAGLTVTATGRFARALQDYAGQGIPGIAGDRDQIKLAMRGEMQGTSAPVK